MVKEKNPNKEISEVLSGKKKVFKLDDGHNAPLYVKKKKK